MKYRKCFKGRLIQCPSSSLADLLTLVHSSLIARVLSLYVEGHIKPIQHRRFEAQHIVDAFRYMQKGQNIGKIVISLPEQAADIPATASSTVAFSSASTYLLVGGLGGLGRVLATWMVDRGARRLLFLSRSAESPSHEPFLQELRSQGCQVIAVAGSVEEKDDIAKAISKASSPISGVAFLSAVIRVSEFRALFLLGMGVMLKCCK